MLVRILFINTRRKLGLHEKILDTVLNRGAQADARGATQVLDRGGQAVARGAVPCVSQVLGRCAQAVARGNARSASQMRDRGVQAVAQTASCCDAVLPQP